MPSNFCVAIGASETVYENISFIIFAFDALTSNLRNI